MKTLRVFGVLLAVLTIVLFPTLSFAAETDVDRLLNLLVEKGVLTEEDAAGFRADLAILRQDEQKQQKEFPLIAGKPIKFSGYTQVRFQSLQENGKLDSFDVRRSRLDVKSEITPGYDYRVQVDFGGVKGPFLLDAIAGVRFGSNLRLAIGQFKIPFSMENLTSSPKLETINRAQAVEALTARGGDVIGNQNGRDIGVQLSGGFLPGEDAYRYDYTLGIFNGSGINTADKNDQKDYASRLVWRPQKGLDIGASYYNGKGNWGTPSPKNQNRDRLGLEFSRQRDPLSLKGEFISGKDGTVRKTGWYLQSGYFFVPGKVQGVLKYDVYDPNRDAAGDATRVVTLGFNRYFNKRAFLQLDYELKDERGTEIDNNVLLSQFTLQF